MTEENVAFLYKISTDVFKTETHTEDLLRSYYLMRCHSITRTVGLPSKQFSSQALCSFCCAEWRVGNYETQVRPIKLSKGQRKRIRKAKNKSFDKNSSINKEALLRSNLMERKCLLCKNVTKIPLEKPNKSLYMRKSTVCKTEIAIPVTTSSKDTSNKTDSKKQMAKISVKKDTIAEIDVYSRTNDVFLLANKSNAIFTQKQGKVIKNNKKKKDKFAGLCKEAVLATAKLTKTKEKQNKLNLFLKPSK